MFNSKNIFTINVLSEGWIYCCLIEEETIFIEKKCFFYLQYLVSPIEQEFFIDFIYFAMIFMTKHTYFTAPLSTDDRGI